jgi:SAM-dependent methyltransferase
MQPFIRAFVQDALESLDPPDPVVEFGALQAEPDQDADLRPLFGGRDFTGTDFREGPGVDRVEDLRALSYPDDSVGTAICLETLEHCEDPIAAGRELARVVAPGGVCLVSTPLLLGIHGYPNDFFRYTPEGMRAILGSFDHVTTWGCGDPGMPLWVFAIAVNGRELDVDLGRLPRLRAAQERFEAAPGKVRLGPLRFEPRELVRALLAQTPRLAREKLRRRRSA